MKSEIFYLDNEDNLVDKESSTHAIVREYDENGSLVNEVFMEEVEDSSKEQSSKNTDLIKEFEQKYAEYLKK